MVTSDFNENATGQSNLDDSKEVGPNCSLELPGISGEIPVTNVSFSEEADTDEVQYTTGFNKDITVTGVSYSGSFDIDGNANNVRDEGWSNADSDGYSLPKHVPNLVITDSNRTYTFVDVMINSHSKDIPSDGRTSQSFDFVAQRAYQS